ncbi:hypothetical protein ABIE09_000450 [Lysobacter enzymogenes]|uniref:hypothetical protein n=1 Tax=Lysobacter enzymogenes TaxID=69 RepID=UPI003392B300
MNGFLRHIVRRAQGQAPVLERRRPSLYESRQEPAAEANEAIGTQAAATAVETRRAFEPESARTAPRAPVAVSEPVADKAVPQNIDTPPPALPRAATTPAPTSGPATLIESIQTLRETVVAVSANATAPNQTPQPPRRDTTPAATIDAPTIRPQRDATPSPTALRSPPSVATRASAADPRPAQAQTPAPPPAAASAPARAPAPPPPLPAPARLAARDAAPAAVAHPARRNAPAAPAPVAPAPVQVSIGRVEIRAGAPAATPAAAPRRNGAPALGLDDYLRQRHGDRR